MNGFIYNGFQPTIELLEKAQNIYWRVESTAPARSAQSAILSKEKGLFTGKIRIASAVGEFLGEATGTDPVAVIEDLYQQLKSQLSGWRSMLNSDI